jgi:hypothetical protein
LSVAEARVSGRLDKNKSQVKIDIKSLQEIFPARLAKINFLFEKTEAITRTAKFLRQNSHQWVGTPRPQLQ